VHAADKVYELGTSRMEEIKIEHYGWKQDLLLYLRQKSTVHSKRSLKI